MTVIAIAFSTTGDTASKGHYIRELLALRVNEQGQELARLHLHVNDGPAASDRPTLAASYAALNEFIGADPVVIHDGYAWKRFLRYGLNDQPVERAAQLTAQTVNVSAWSRRTYPREQKDLAAVLKRLDLSVDAAHEGLERDVWDLVKIEPAVRGDAGQKLAARSEASDLGVAAGEINQPVSVAQRMQWIWRVLTGTG
jgi:hypothetical protein